MQIQEDNIDLLTEIGFTKTQAKLYLALIRIGKTNIKSLSKHVDTPRQEIYRALSELQEKGFVERILVNPLEYEATPLKETLERVLNIKAEEYNRTLDKTKQIQIQFSKEDNIEIEKENYSIKIIEGKDTIVNKYRFAHLNVVRSVCVCSTFQRWIQIGREINETIQKVSDRGIEYRLVVEKPNGDFCLPQEFSGLKLNENFQIKFYKGILEINAAIFDDKFASFSFYPSKSIAESPVVWTNHPSILVCFREYFEKLWRSAEKI